MSIVFIYIYNCIYIMCNNRTTGIWWLSFYWENINSIIVLLGTGQSISIFENQVALDVLLGTGQSISIFENQVALDILGKVLR